ncbi:unnamed protein product [Notodromas monacha]|uniref:Bis(5'-nucleosyl)-tetraphosphatase [asymmetrical] n=1 Tax=Notodromas monacha TaxID=399045 RepID=A0A7R9BIC6_9CRUS|nr:unnamed protein product [Notodromas monacha]CAG0914472.1 unnamed protein product [Notodromas monacha]
MKRAAGLVVYRHLNGVIEYLMMQTSYGTFHWTPPKGHVDPGENDMQTALRETEEEAGLRAADLEVDSNFKRTLEYLVKGEPKTVIYWLAKLRNPTTPVILSEEHRAFQWLGLSAAKEVGGFGEMKQLLEEAEIYLREKL